MCISLDFRNLFNTFSRPAVFRALLASPDFVDLYTFLSQIYFKADRLHSSGPIWGSEIGMTSISCPSSVYTKAAPLGASSPLWTSSLFSGRWRSPCHVA